MVNTVIYSRFDEKLDKAHISALDLFLGLS